MSTIEERVVSMKFDGNAFLAGIDKSLQKLDQFNQKLKMTEGTKGLDGIGAAAQRQSGALSTIATGVQHISDRFKAMGIVGMTAIENVTNQAIFKGQQMIKSLTVAPIMDGFREYETNMNSIQTILSNTRAAGTKLSDVTAVLDELNHYSDQTIYNFSEMAKNIGTFTAAGVALKPAASAIKGIANLAALSGTNSEKAAGAMYQLSQAISSGRVTLEDWESVRTAGMGGAVFQRALAQTAVAMGKLDEGALKLKGSMKNVEINGKSFRDSISSVGGKASWLTGDVLIKTLQQFTGDMKDAELAAMGFSATQIKEIQAQAKAAKAAATEVKTMSQLLGTIKESAGSGWAQTWKIVFGDFEAAKKLFTGVNDVIGGFIEKQTEARNKMLQEWADKGGRTAIINSLGNAFKGLVSVLKPIRDAFRQIFPPATGKQLADISKTIETFSKKLIVGSETADKIKRVFAGFFAVIGIGWDILKGFIGMVGRLIGVASEGGGGFLDFAAKVGDFLVNLRQAIKEGKGIQNFFRGLGALLEIPIRAFKLFGQALSKAFDKVGGDKVIGAVEKISEKMDPMADQAEKVASGWEKVKNTLIGVWQKIEAIGSWIVEKFAGIGELVSGAFSGMNFEDITRGLNTGIFASLAVMFKLFIGGGAGGGLIEGLTDSLESLTTTLRFMQGALVAATLLQIAIAIGILALSLNLLAKIDAAGLATGTAAMTGLVAQLMATMLVVEKFSTWSGAAKLPFIAGSLILLGLAVLILSSALKKLSGLEWEEIAKGLTGVGVLLGMLVLVANNLPKGPSFVMGALSIILMATAVRILAGAVTNLSGLSWEAMARGLVGTTVLMAALVGFMNTAKVSSKGALNALVIFVMAKAIQMLADAVEDISRLSWDQMARGLAATGIGLGLLAASLRAVPPSAILSAAGMLIAAQAMTMINDAVAKSSGMSWEEIGRGMTVVAGTLVLLAASLKVMQGSMGGAAALAIAALSLNSLSVSLQKNAKLSWEEIGKGMTVIAGSIIILATAMRYLETAQGGELQLIAIALVLGVLSAAMVPLAKLSWGQIAAGLTILAGTFIILGLAALILQPILPAIYSLGVGLALVGVAMLAAGAGIALFGLGIMLLAAGLAALAVSGVAGTTALIGMISVLIGGLPTILELIGKLLIGLLQLVIDAVPKIQEAAVAIMTGFLNGLRQVVPLVIEVVLFLLLTLVTKLASYVPRIADQGLKMITALLNVWASRIGSVVNAAANLIVAFLRGLAKELPRIASAATNLITTFIREVGKNAPKIADAAAKAIIDFVNGMAKAVRDNAEAMRSAGKNLAMAIIDGMTGGLGSGVGRIADEARRVARSALDAAKNVLGINSPSKEFEKIGRYVNDGFRKGLDGNRGQIDSAFNNLKKQLASAMKSSAKEVDRLEAKLKKLNSARKKDAAAIKKTKAALAQAKKENAAEKRAYDLVNKTLKGKHTQLSKLAKSYDALTPRIEEANKKLQDAIKTRDDFAKQTKDQYDDLPDMSGETTLASYVEDLRKKIADTQEFATKLQKLRDLGLNDELYKELLSKGPEALPFINDVLASGKDGVNELNNLSGQLDSVAGNLGTQAGKALYQAGVDAAQGLVDGLKRAQGAIEKTMDLIANQMINSIKKALGIKSPSREFMKVGDFSIQGLAKGLEAASPGIEKASTQVGRRTLDSLRASLSDMPHILSDMDAQPTIRPVIDLSDVRKGVGSIGKMMPWRHRISVGTAYSSAKAASAGYQANRDADFVAGLANHTEVNYTQINNSPKALSPAEIYRNTKNQLSRTKGALTNA